MKHIAILLCLATPALAECPAPPDHDVAIARLIEQLRAAPDQASAEPLNARLWELWTDAPDAAAQEVLEAGMRRRANYDFTGALAQFDRLVDYCPDYAEGYNQRAFVNFLRQDYAAVLTDLDAALELSPTHVGALSGKAMTLMGMGRTDEGQDVLRQALGLNPWLAERAMLIPRPGEKL
ncbi:tetratricopeptide repeat protein [Lacimonas salitolerans]|uniref:Tetratricopeptide repeat protein n=1 Tax=Lacimonas salitolerans TaxID=1323750 RepID=A0ABW4EEZ4_9RHOB